MAAAIDSRTEYALTTAGNNLAPTFTQTTGDLVIICIATSISSDFTSISDNFNYLSPATPGTFTILYKVLVGTEGGSCEIVSDVSTKACAIAFNIATASFQTPPEINTVATGTDTGPDPGNIDAAIPSLDYLWIATFRQAGEEADDDTWCNSAPTNFTNLVQKTTGTTGAASVNCSVAAANFNSTDASMNPAVFNTDQSLAWRAFTIAIPPASAATEDPFLIRSGGYYPDWD
jgi:hypothetical protein